MRFAHPLVRGTLIRRYKRFLADVMLEDGREITAHCANPGAMLGLAGAGLSVWLEPSDNPKRKLGHSWRLVEVGTSLVGIDTALPNRIVAEALAARQVAPLAAYATVRPEVCYGTRSRVDFLLTGQGLPDAYVEVKNVHLLRQTGLAEFPDSVTTRGARHLGELSAMVAAGHRALLIYLVQRTDCTRFAIARDLDPTYARASLDACTAGVEMLAYACRIDQTGIWLGGALPIES